ncbi:class I SAM-dependent methyltransferase [Pelagovum sp. HNIBRBA483]|uniref:class I SAM-dependent DNA methyltransferase n=1 Tax=Pelagovum sp. HNIBRBA483 TaxID=3233341 RepID=UPI0034A1C353
MTTKSPDLDDAYALKSADDAKRVYAAWAETYDKSFVDGRSYVLHERVAEDFVEKGGSGPVLDLGAGTGVLATALASLNVGPLEAADISSEMLEQASRKGLYRRLFVTDPERPLPFPDESLNGIVSSGTFTLGHLGPEILPDLMRILRPGGLMTISVNSAHYAEAGFEKAIGNIRSQIAALHVHTVDIYANSDATDEHAHDTAKIVSMRKKSA